MKAAVLEELGAPFVLKDWPVPEIGPDEALVATHACGMCGTDLHIKNGYAYVPTLPHILGHEAAGVVAKVGENVKNVKVGDRVASYIFTTCGDCYYCRVGRDSQCINMTGAIGAMTKGGFAEYFSVPGENLFLLPDNVPFEAGCLIADAVITSLHGFRRTRLTVGDTAVIVGSGGIGQILIQLCKAAGIKTIATSRSQGKLDYAGKMGADLVVKSDSADAVARIKAFSGGDGAQCVFDTVGSSATMEASASYVMRGGQILVIGEEPDFPPIDTIRIAQREIEIIGSRNGTRQDMRDCVELVASGVIKPHIDRVFPLDEINEAFDLFKAGGVNGRIVIKVR